MRVLKAIVFIICATISSNCFAQNVSVRYIYDESGNRISRTLVTAKAEQDGRCVADDGFAEHQSLAHNNTDDNGIFVYRIQLMTNSRLHYRNPRGKPIVSLCII